METAMIKSHHHTIADLALSVGIDFNRVAERLHYETFGQPISGNIAIDKEANEGNPYIFVNAPFIDSKGNKYPNITFGTYAHGGYTVNFNGYRESQADKPLWIPKPIIKPVAPLPDNTWRIKAFETALTAFNLAKSEGVENHPYIIKKGVNVIGCDIRLVNGLLQYAIHDITGKLLGFQTINAEGKKRFIGGMSGGFIVIGNKELIKFGAIFEEGLATGLSTFHSKTLNPKGLPVVVCLDAGNMRKVVAAFVEKYGADIIHLYADNDCGLNNKGEFTGNTGVYVALEICHEHGIKSFKMPVSVNGEKCDFNDTQEFMNVEVPTGINYQIELIKVCSKLSLHKHFKKFTDDIIRDTKINAKTTENTADYFTISECMEIITRTAALRGINCDIHYELSIAIAHQIAFKEKYLVNEFDITNIIQKTIAVLASHGVICCVQAVRKMLRKAVTRGREIQRKQKTIINKAAFDKLINVDGLTPGDVSEEIERESLLNKIMVFDNAGMGGNKTNRYIAYSKGLEGGTLVITALVAICKDLIERFSKAGTDILDYQNLSAAFFDALRHEVNTVFCINSITKKGDITDNFKHIFVDEAVAVFDSMMDDTGTNKHQQKLLVDVLRAIFTNADSIVISDATLADKHVEFYKSLCDNKHTILLETTPVPSEVNYYLLQNHTHTHEFILRDVEAGRSGVVACDTVGNATGVKKYLRDNGVNNRIDINRILLATGENNGEAVVSEFIENPNENAYRWDVVIHSPIIRSGTSIEYADYEFAYLLYDGVISTSDAMQMWGRCRAAKNRYVSFGSRIDRTRITDADLLMQNEINQITYELDQKGLTVSIQCDELSRLRHEFTAQKNADLNDFKNNFLFHCQINGWDVIRLESDTKLDKGLTAEVKAQRCEDRFAAEALTPTRYKYIKQANRRTQAETNAMKRFEVVAVVHGENAEVDSVITFDDCVNEMNGIIKPLLAFESLMADTTVLKAQDNEDKRNDCLKYKRTDLQKALHEILKPLTVANNSGGITKKVFNKTCDKLEKHCAILAAAGLGNFKKINRIRAGATVGNLLKKIGLETKQLTAQTGVRIYEVKVNDQIARYAMNRKEIGRTERGAVTDNFSAITDLFYLKINHCQSTIKTNQKHPDETDNFSAVTEVILS